MVSNGPHTSWLYDHSPREIVEVALRTKATRSLVPPAGDVRAVGYDSNDDLTTITRRYPDASETGALCWLTFWKECTTDNDRFLPVVTRNQLGRLGWRVISRKREREDSTPLGYRSASLLYSWAPGTKVERTTNGVRERWYDVRNVSVRFRSMGYHYDYLTPPIVITSAAGARVLSDPVTDLDRYLTVLERGQYVLIADFGTGENPRVFDAGGKVVFSSATAVDTVFWPMP